MKNIQEQKNLADFQSIYDSHHEEILHYLLKHTPTPEDAWDLLQDIFLKLYQALKNPAGHIKQVRGFLYQLCKNQVHDFYKQEPVGEDIQEDLLEVPFVPQEDKLAVEIASALDCCFIAPRLTPRQQMGLRLNLLGGLNLSEIATFLEVSRPTVRTDLEKGFQVVRNLFAAEGLTLELVG